MKFLQSPASGLRPLPCGLWPVACGLLFLCAIAGADSYSSNPTVDAYGVDGNLPFLGPPKDGTFDSLVDIDVLSVFNTTSLETRFAMEFDISSIPSGASVSSATLTLTEDIDPAFGFPLDIKGYVGNGAITTGDMIAGALLASLTTDGVPNVLTIDVTTFIQSLVSGTPTYAGFVGLDPSESSLLHSTFSNEALVPANRPLLDVTFSPTVVPEPSSILLYSLGILGGVLCLKRARTVQFS